MRSGPRRRVVGVTLHKVFNLIIEFFLLRSSIHYLITTCKIAPNANNAVTHNTQTGWYLINFIFNLPAALATSHFLLAFVPRRTPMGIPSALVMLSIEMVDPRVGEIVRVETLALLECRLL